MKFATDVQKRAVHLIRPYEKNAKEHPKKQLKQIAASIREFGFNQPIVVDRHGVIIVGHGRYAAATEILHLEQVPVVVVDVTEEQAKAYRLADNKLNESEWNMELVIEELKGMSLAALDLTGFDRDLVLENTDKEDAYPYTPATPRTKVGDFYEIGQHKILCGDCTKPENWDKLMANERASMVLTDPPYGMEYTGSATKKREKIEGDGKEEIAYGALMGAFLAQCLRYTDSHAPYYVFTAPPNIGELYEQFDLAGLHAHQLLMWMKHRIGFGGNDYQRQYEPFLYGWKKDAQRYFVDDRTQSDVWDDLEKVRTRFDGTHTTIEFGGYKVRIAGKVEDGKVIRKRQHIDIWQFDRPVKSEEHPTMKPVALLEHALVNSSKRGDIVLDPFLGSGSTAIACEKSERKCYGMELMPKYVDVIVQRLVDFTGNTEIIRNGVIESWQVSDKVAASVEG